MIDFHNHLMPGVDDGAENLDESRAALTVMREQGFQTIITTPHIRASLLARPAELAEYLERVDRAWHELTELASAEFPTMRVERGFEVMLDVPRPNFSDPLFRLAGTRFVLVEFPFLAIPLNSAQALLDITLAGYVPIVAHPERYANVAQDLATVAAWRQVGGMLQVNAGSLVGQYGQQATEIAWTLLKRGWADYLCSDYHAHGKCATDAAREAILDATGEAQCELLTETNAARLLRGVTPESVSPLPARKVSGWLGRLLR